MYNNNFNKYKYFLTFLPYLIVLIIIFFSFLPVTVLAEDMKCSQKYPNDGTCVAKDMTCFDGSSADATAGLCEGEDKCCHQHGAQAGVDLQVAIGGQSRMDNIGVYIKSLYQTALYIIVPLLIVFTIGHGVLWIIAAGDKQLISKAKNGIIQGFIGLAIALFSYLILSTVGISGISLIQVEYIAEAEFEYEIFDTPEDANFQGAYGAGDSMAPPVAGSMPRLFQCDNRNVGYGCGGKNLCSSGCGLMSSVMVMRYYGVNVSPSQAAAWIVNNGYRGGSAAGSTCSGTTYTGITAVNKAFGMAGCEQVGKNFETAKSYASGGKPLIAHVRDCNQAAGKQCCKFTGRGHYIVVSGWDAPNNRFIINDPGSKATNRYNGTWNELASGCQLHALLYCHK